MIAKTKQLLGGREPQSSNTVKQGSTSDFIDHLITESDAMFKHIAGQGNPIPPEIPGCLYAMQQKQQAAALNQSIAFSEQELQELAQMHQQLAKLIAPAKPKTIALMNKEAASPRLLYFLGPVTLVRRLSISAVISLLTIIIVSTSSQVNQVTINQGLFASEGVTLLLNQLFLLGCAGLGATFACLNQVNYYVKKGIYDPKFDSTYWTLVIMGLMGGLIIAELIPMQALDPKDAAEITSFGKPVAALLGGFSADVIYRILNRLVDMVNQFLGNTKVPDDKQADNVSQLNQQLEQIQQTNRQLQIQPTGQPDTTQAKPSAVNRLSDTIAQIDATTHSPAQIEQLMQQLENVKQNLNNDDKPQS